MNIILTSLSGLEYLNTVPIILIIIVAFFLIKSLGMIFKIIAYVFVIFIIYYFFW